MFSNGKEVFPANITPSKFVLLSATNHVVAHQIQAFQSMSTVTALVVRNTMFDVKTPCRNGEQKSLR